jgi:hypothetical protein
MKAPPRLGDKVVVNGEPRDMTEIISSVLDGAVPLDLRDYIVSLVVGDAQRHMSAAVAKARRSQAVAEHVVTLVAVGNSEKAAVESASQCFGKSPRMVRYDVKRHGSALQPLMDELRSLTTASLARKVTPDGLQSA